MLTHLIEIRQRALKILIVFSLFFVIFFIFAKELFHLLVMPLIYALPAENSLIATQITSAVLTPITLAANFALLCTAPFALLHLWRFVAPGLYQDERHKLSSFIFISVFLFAVGVLFCFYLVLPFMFQFFTHALPKGVKMMPDMANALEFITRMLLIFGICFQVPLICLSLVQMNWIDISALRQIRPYVIVAAFTIGMLLTPPDVLSQIALALPLCLLYELGIFFAYWQQRSKLS